MDFKLPTFSAIVFGVIGGFVSFFLSLQIMTLRLITDFSESIPREVYFFSNPFVGILIGLLVGFLVGFVLEVLFRKKDPNSGGIKFNILKKWWFWVILAVLIIVWLLDLF